MAEEVATKQHGMRTFVVVWAGQFVSLVGTGLTGFAQRTPPIIARRRYAVPTCRNPEHSHRCQDASKECPP